ncbi:MAG: hypothetical protein JW912_07710, partial [Sedimentisphaerales bacterium]|nr:hypothetical protein [Sedimentisphaerales bacterium]
LFLLHLLTEDHHHDCDNCPVCQQSIINKNNAALSSYAKTFSVNEISFTISNIRISPLQAENFRLPSLRAPPSVS